MEKFKSMPKVQEYLSSNGWAVTGGKPVSLATIKKAVLQGKLKRSKDGTYHQGDIDSYARAYLISKEANEEGNSIASIKMQQEKEKLRKLKLENDRKTGELIPFSDEIKRRVAVIQAMKASMINGRSSFMRQLRSNMKERHQDSDILNDLLSDAAEFYEDCVLTVFDSFEKKGTI